MTDQENVERENRQLKRSLEEFKNLEEDLAAHRIFNRAKKFATYYLAFGGTVVVIAGYFGYSNLYELAKSGVDSKIESLTDAGIKDIVIEVIDKRVSEALNEVTAESLNEIIATGTQQVQRQFASNQPASTKSNSAVNDDPLLSVEFAIDYRTDYSPDMLPIRNSGMEASSIAFATASALEFQLFKATGSQTRISPRFIYYYSRLEGGFQTDQDTGAFVRDAIKVLQTRGAIEDEVWPYADGDFAAEPSNEVSSAAHYTIEESGPNFGIESIKSLLYSNGPVVATVTIFNSIYDGFDQGPAVLAAPTLDDYIAGVTAFCIVGYDDENQMFKFRNSWGTDWGESGYGYMTYDYAERYVDDVWAMTPNLESSQPAPEQP